jgi:hypothetical protein
MDRRRNGVDQEKSSKEQNLRQGLACRYFILISDQHKWAWRHEDIRKAIEIEAPGQIQEDPEKPGTMSPMICHPRDKRRLSYLPTPILHWTVSSL